MNPMMPMNEAMLGAVLSMFLKVSMIMTGLVSLVFIIRTSILVTTVARAGEYGEVLKSVVLYFGLIQLFPSFVKLIISSSGVLASKIAFIPSPEAQDLISGFVNRLFGDYVLLKVFGAIGDIIVIGVANSFYTSLISLLLCIAPIIIFLSTMLGLSHGIKTYLSIFLALCLWPTLWNILGLLGRELTSQVSSSPISVVLFWFVIQAMQFLSPLFCVSLFKNLSASSAFTSVIKVAKWI